MRASLLSLAVGLVFIVAVVAHADGPPAPIRAYFLGYQNDDVIVRIYNESAGAVSIKGLSFNHQVLYRPVEKDVIVPVSAEGAAYIDMAFRSNGDFVWSENHMNMFELAYQLLNSDERMYAPIYPHHDVPAPAL